LYKIPANTLFIGQSLVFMPECHSTNDELAQQIKAGNVAEGAVVVTANQTAGRGQRGSAWLSEAGMNLTFSVLLKPHFLYLRDQFYLNMCVALGLADYLKHTLDKTVRIKWPNDIMVTDKKVCGILIENQLSGQRMLHSIAGIGLNVNQQKFEFEKAGSMRTIAGHDFDLPLVLEELLEKIEVRYRMLHQQQFQKLGSDYLACMYWLGEKHLFTDSHTQFEGIITGIDEIGRLLIEMEEGVKVFGVKEITFVQ
jgi:BirA family transcriptional regulator, biotin operon repressor / biotin---[acetyl-CoA-carboxylase] ligase